MVKKGGATPPAIGTEMETIKLGGKTIKFKKGALHKMLKVPLDEDIGVSNLRKIARSETGSSVVIKGKTFKVSPLMKKRAVFGLNISGNAKKTRGSKKGDKSKTRKGDKDYTTKRGDKDFHQGGRDIKKTRNPY